MQGKGQTLVGSGCCPRNRMNRLRIGVLLSYRLRKRLTPACWALIFLLCSFGAVGYGQVRAEHGADPTICRPILSPFLTVELGKPGLFQWICDEEKEAGNGFYIVFIRPNSTYVLLKVPQGRSSFEFTPDMVGMWRWIVINTDPDRSKPDLESDPSNFLVIEAQSRN